MYGFVHEVLIELVLSRPNGEELWQDVVTKAGYDQPTNYYSYYSDQTTLSLVQATAEVLGLQLNDVLYMLGERHLASMLDKSKGYLSLVKTLGRNFYEFCQNLDTLHQNISASFPAMRAPSFRADDRIDNTFMLHYYSSRRGLYPYAIAMLKSVATMIFNTTIEIEHVSQKGRSSSHDIFKVIMEEDDLDEDDGLDGLQSAQLDLGAGDIDSLFPWHVAFDKHMRVRSMGHALSKRVTSQVGDPKNFKLFEVVKLSKPALPSSSFEAIKGHSDAAFTLIVRDAAFEQAMVEKSEKAAVGGAGRRQSNASQAGGCPFSRTVYPNRPSAADSEMMSLTTADAHSIPGTRRESLSSVMSGHSAISLGSATSSPRRCLAEFPPEVVQLKGQMHYVEHKDWIVFLGIPYICQAGAFEASNVKITDIPLHTSGRDMVFRTEYQSVTTAMANQLQESADMLDNALEELNGEKQRVQELLHSILPPQIAETLTKGKRPRPQTFHNVALLFSDIVGFTTISGSVGPIEVMGMLNELFSEFDELCTKMEVFKVETIGDAYMVAVGLTPETDKGPARLADYALQMLKVSKKVKSPADGEPISMRIGLHFGTVMAGVVGDIRPRYCLFGDTVNVSSRMESTSVPGCIQVSDDMRKAIEAESDEYVFLSRCPITVKGKGTMSNAFLLGKGDDVDIHSFPPFHTISMKESVEHITHLLSYRHKSSEHARLLALSGDTDLDELDAADDQHSALQGPGASPATLVRRNMRSHQMNNPPTCPQERTASILSKKLPTLHEPTPSVVSLPVPASSESTISQALV